jgi:hypothetical protein
MESRPTITITLTKEQQLEVLAATGLLVRTLELDPEAPDESGVVLASIALPRWLIKETTAGAEVPKASSRPPKTDAPA